MVENAKSQEPKFRARPRVMSLSEDGRSLKIALTLPNGERVIGEYRLSGWGRPPAAVRAQVVKALSRPPRFVIGARGAGR